MRQTTMLKPAEVKKDWYVVDASGKNLGRLATQCAAILRGKHKPTFTPNVDCGDYVIIVNAAKVVYTGDQENKNDPERNHPVSFGKTKPEEKGRNEKKYGADIEKCHLILHEAERHPMVFEIPQFKNTGKYDIRTIHKRSMCPALCELIQNCQKRRKKNSGRRMRGRRGRKQ